MYQRSPPQATEPLGFSPRGRMVLSYPSRKEEDFTAEDAESAEKNKRREKKDVTRQRPTFHFLCLFSAFSAFSAVNVFGFEDAIGEIAIDSVRKTLDNRDKRSNIKGIATLLAPIRLGLTIWYHRTSVSCGVPIKESFMSSQPRRRRLEVEHIGDVTVVNFVDRKILDEQNIQVIGDQLFGLVDTEGLRKLLVELRQRGISLQRRAGQADHAQQETASGRRTSDPVQHRSRKSSKSLRSRSSTSSSTFRKKNRRRCRRFSSARSPCRERERRSLPIGAAKTEKGGREKRCVDDPGPR